MCSAHPAYLSSPSLLPRVTEVLQEVGWEPKPGQQVVLLELGCEGEEEDIAFPPLHYQLPQGCTTNYHEVAASRRPHLPAAASPATLNPGNPQ